MTSAVPARVLPREIVVEKIRDGIRYRLPMRQIGMIRLIGLIPLGFALVFMLTPVFWFGPFLKDAFMHPNFLHLFFALFLAFWFYGTSKPMTFGLLILGGRCKVELTRGWLRAVDSFGPFRIARRARREDIKCFSVDVSNDKQMPRFLSALRLLGGLEAKFENAKAMPVAVAYPREWLTALGDALTHHINETNIIEAAAPLPATTEVVKQFSSELRPALATDDVTVQPKSSRVRVDETRDSITLVVPPSGLVRGTNKLFSFAVVWCAFMTVFTVVVVFIGKHNATQMIPFLLATALFWTIGIAMMLGAMNMGRRRALLVASAGDLRIAQESLFGKKIWSWSRHDLQSIRVDRSGMEVNYKPVLELQIHPADGNKVGLFAGRDELELQWIATVLREKLGVPATA